MRNSNSADFFLTGMVVLWPLLLWVGSYELGVFVFASLLFAVWACGMLDEGDDDRPERQSVRDTSARDRSRWRRGAPRS